jgi:hypothetical protein
MHVSPTIATVVMTIGLLAACASPLLAPDDRKNVCQVAVDRKFGSPVVHTNPYSSPAGGLTGAAGGALAGLVAFPPSPMWFLMVPVGAVYGATRGAACAAASQSHPNAEADFEKFLKAADASKLTRTLEADLNAPREGCAAAQAGASAAPVPDTIIEIEKVDVGMGCAIGKQEYWISVKWRALVAANRRVLVETTTRCSQKSFLGVDDWFADPDRARLEIENVLESIGRRMASGLLSPQVPSECKW